VRRCKPRSAPGSTARSPRHGRLCCWSRLLSVSGERRGRCEFRPARTAPPAGNGDPPYLAVSGASRGGAGSKICGLLHASITARGCGCGCGECLPDLCRASRGGHLGALHAPSAASCKPHPTRPAAFARTADFFFFSLGFLRSAVLRLNAAAGWCCARGWSLRRGDRG